MLEYIPNNFSVIDFYFNYVEIRQHTWCDLIPSNYLRFFLCPRMWTALVNNQCTFEKNIYTVVINGVVHKPWFDKLFENIKSLICYWNLLILLNFEGSQMKSSTLICLCLLTFVSFYFIVFEVLLSHAYVFRFIIFFWETDLYIITKWLFIFCNVLCTEIYFIYY